MHSFSITLCFFLLMILQRFSQTFSAKSLIRGRDTSMNFRSMFSSFSSTSSNPKRVAISGSTGLIGSALVNKLISQNIQVIRISTSKVVGNNDIMWNPENGEFKGDLQVLEGLDAVINLSGENIGSGDGPFAFLGRWSESKKDKILSSRKASNKLFIDSFKYLKNKPKTFLSASAVGFYGYTDFENLYDEKSSKGTGFAADVCAETENEVFKAKQLGIRTCALRFAVVLSPKGGIIAKLLVPFSLAAGGIIGSGNQGFSWVTLNDAIRAILYILENPSIDGPVNIASPEPVTNAIFTDSFGKALKRPTIVPLPTFVASTLFGQMGEELILGGQKCVPSKLLKAGFKFEDAEIYDAMKSVL